jgi:glutathione S-transferase
MYTLYVIPGSHACRSAMLMLAHKRERYRRVDIVTLMHPVVVRLLGFDANGETRTAGGRRPLALRIADQLGTVPALAAGSNRISTNHEIARYLDEVRPERPLLPADPDHRTAVEAAERWANETLQMEARRIPGAATIRDPRGYARSSGDGRLGHLLFRSELARRMLIPGILGGTFATSGNPERDPIVELPALLNRIDAWIAEGVLNGEELNVADFMVAPSLALILYRADARPLFKGRPALDLVDRLLPEPVGA